MWSRCCGTAGSSGPTRSPARRRQPRHRHARAAGQPRLSRQTAAAGRRAHRARRRWVVRPPGVEDASLTLRAGEIVGLAGLIGAGRSELVRAIYGAAPATAGRVHVRGRRPGRRPAASIEAGVALIPESRKDDGLILRRPIRENVSLDQPGPFPAVRFCPPGCGACAGPRRPRTRRPAPRCWRPRPGRCPAATSRSCCSPGPCSSSPGVLLADEPTRGIDVGAKRDIYERAGSPGRRRDGDPAHLERGRGDPGLAHRVLVMRAGRLVAELSGADMTEEAIVGAAFGTTITTAA